MPTLRIPESKSIPAWMGWTIILGVTVLSHVLWVTAALELWRLLILARQS